MCQDPIIWSHGSLLAASQVENIMLTNEGHVKLIDFGLCREIQAQEEPLSPTGSLIYMSPEMLKDNVGGRHTDWWALGILAHELLTGRSPWSSLTDKKLIRKQIRTMTISPPQNVSGAAGQFVCQLLSHDVPRRLGTQSSSQVKPVLILSMLPAALLTPPQSGNPSSPSNHSPHHPCIAPPVRWP